MAPDASANAYPKPSVDPELFSGELACGRALPAGEVIEWFDFGQFVELYATDASGVSHPLVVTQDDAVLQASLKVREEGSTLARTVDLAGGVPLNRAVSGDGEESFKVLGIPDLVVVEDVDALIRSGTITTGGTTYSLMLRAEQAVKLRDGERLLLRAKAVTGGSTKRVWLELTPRIFDVQVMDLDSLLAARTIMVELSVRSSVR